MRRSSFFLPGNRRGIEFEFHDDYLLNVTIGTKDPETDIVFGVHLRQGIKLSNDPNLIDSMWKAVDSFESESLVSKDLFTFYLREFENGK